LQQQFERQRDRFRSPSFDGTPDSLILLDAGSGTRHVGTSPPLSGWRLAGCFRRRERSPVEVTGAEIKTISKGCAPMTVGVAARVKDKVFDAKETVLVTADVVKEHLYEGTEALQTTAGKVVSRAKGRTRQAGALLPPVAAPAG
jgi:hypothetical protein